MNKNPYIISLSDIAKDNTDKLAVISGEQGNVKMHKHNFFELAYVIDGTSVHSLNEKENVLKKGDYFIIDYGSRHAYSESINFTIINCLFLPEMIENSFTGCKSFEELIKFCLIRYSKQYYGLTAVNRIFHDGDGKVLKLLKSLQDEYETKQIGFREIFRCNMLEILIIMMRQMIQSEKSEIHNKVQNTTVLKMIYFMDNHFQTKAVVSLYCKEYHYSPQYISRLFKSETGITAQEYIQNIRIEKSCTLLAGSNLQIQEIARLVGYEDVKFYTKLFRKKLKMSPGEYRKVSELE